MDKYVVSFNGLLQHDKAIYTLKTISTCLAVLHSSLDCRLVGHWDKLLTASILTRA